MRTGKNATKHRALGLLGHGVQMVVPVVHCYSAVRFSEVLWMALFSLVQIFMDWRKIQHSWGSKFVFRVYSFIIYTENCYSVGTGTRGWDPPQKPRKLVPHKIKPSTVGQKSRSWGHWTTILVSIERSQWIHMCNLKALSNESPFYSSQKRKHYLSHFKS